MADYLVNQYVPWYLYKSDIKKVVVENGVTSIGDHAFYGCSSLTSIDIPNNVTSIGEYAFNCYSLKEITFKSPDTMIPDSAYAISSSATIYGYEGSVAQAYAQKYNRKFVLIGEEDHVCTFGDWEVLGGRSHVRYCTDPDCTASEKQNHVFDSETDMDCNVCKFGAAKKSADFSGDGIVDNNDAIYLLYHTIFGELLYPLS